MESLVKEGVQKKKAKTFFVCFVKRKKKNLHFFYPKEERTSLLKFLKKVMKKAWRFARYFLFFLQLVHLLFLFLDYLR